MNFLIAFVWVDFYRVLVYTMFISFVKIKEDFASNRNEKLKIKEEVFIRSKSISFLRTFWDLILISFGRIIEKK